MLQFLQLAFFFQPGIQFWMIYMSCKMCSAIPFCMSSTESKISMSRGCRGNSCLSVCFFVFYFSIWHLCCGSQCGSWPCSTRHMRNLLLIIALTLRVRMKYRTASIKALHYIWDVLLGNKGLDGCRITKAVVRVLLYLNLLLCPIPLSFPLWKQEVWPDTIKNY